MSKCNGKNEIKTFMKAASIRAIKTFCQTFISMTVGCTLLEDIQWLVVLSSSALAFVLSLATSIAFGIPEVNNNNEDTSQE